MTAITADYLGGKPVRWVRRELSGVQSAIVDSECFGVSDLLYEEMLIRELERRAA